jgi:sugar phosphate isomerase/epimerase
VTLKRPTSRFGSRERDETLELFSTSGLELSAFAYYENDLHPDPQRREEIATHLRHAIDARQFARRAVRRQLGPVSPHADRR